jgi:exopolysaccharide production protein ExoQ
MAISRKLVERSYLLFLLALSTNPLSTVLMSGDGRSGSPITRMSWLFIYIVTLLRLAHRYVQVPPTIGRNLVLFGLFCLCPISALWSVDPAATLHHGAALFMTFFIAVDLSLRYSLKEQMKLYAMVVTAILLMSVITDFLLPGFVPAGVDDEGGLHGVFAFKNEYARFIVLTGIVYLCAQTTRKRWFAPAVIIGTYGFLTLARSAGAIINFTILLMALALCGALRWKPRPKHVALFLAGTLGPAILYVILSNFAKFTALFGKDPHLTGRTELWRLAWLYIQERPILGYGYDAFWGNTMPIAIRIRQAVHWDAPHSHNGAIELLLAMGIVGFVLTLAMYAIVFVRGYAYLLRDRTSLGKWPLILTILLVISQIAEAGGPLAADSLTSIMFVAAACSIVRSRYSDSPKKAGTVGSVRDVLAGAS